MLRHRRILKYIQMFSVSYQSVIRRHDTIQFIYVYIYT